MNVFCKEEHALELQLTDLRLSTLEAIARETCAHNQRMDDRLRSLQNEMELRRRGAAKRNTWVEGNGDVEFSVKKMSVEAGSEGTNLLATLPVVKDEDARMCDYCFSFSPQCFACPLCGREWYCSDVCQRLRQRCHAARCRTCASVQHDNVATL